MVTKNKKQPKKPTIKIDKIDLTINGVKQTFSSNSAPSPVSVYMLLDRSGSMGGRWTEAIASINSYAAELAKDGTDAKITLAAFDGQGGLQFDVLRNAAPVQNWSPVGIWETKPRGMTPLYDAFGKAVEMANGNNAERTVIVVMTDGAENDSRHTTKERTGQLVKECQAKEWQVVFLGADFDTVGQAQAIHVNYGTVLNASQGFYGNATASLSRSTSSYAVSGQSVNFTDADRANAAGLANAPQGVKIGK